VTSHVSPVLYGLMTEEINYSYDGGLYAELIRNRNFKEDAKDPAHWQLVEERGGAGSISLDSSRALNGAIPASLKLTVTQASGDQRVGVANDGFWGIPVRPDTPYRASFYAKAAPGFAGPLTVAIVSAAMVSNDGATVQTSAQVPRVTQDWKKYDVTLTTTGKAAPSAENRLVISAASPGAVWLNMVSLFPPAWNNRPNGNRKDIMQLLADMKPAFLRFPVAFQDRRDETGLAGCFERPTSGRHLVQDRSESEDVRAGVGFFPFQLLGRHVLQGAENGAIGR